MTPEQAKTAKRMGIAFGMFLLTLAVLAWTEYAGVAQGGSSTISEVSRLAFALQPGAIAFVAAIVAFICGGLFTHFWWAGDPEYQRLLKQDQDGKPKEVVK